jgi:hypothetical protein
MSTPAAAFARLLEVLDRMEIPYLVGGSVASSAHGVPRTTLDVDLVVDLRPEQIEEFASDLTKEFYADATMIRDSFARGRAANLIHLGTAWKFDLFPLQEDQYSRVSFTRRSFREVRPDGQDAVECAVATAEDTILRKLEWYRAGGETSERQWDDIRGIWEATSGRLDTGYLRKWADELKVCDLLESLCAEYEP